MNSDANSTFTNHTEKSVGSSAKDGTQGDKPTVKSEAGLNLRQGSVPLVRLSSLQLENAATDVLGVSRPIAKTVPAVPTDDPKADLVPFLRPYIEEARAIAQESVTEGGAFDSVCQSMASRSCVRQFIHGEIASLLRRDPSQSEEDSLLKVFDAYAVDGFRAGLAAVVHAALASPGYLFRPEFIAGAAASRDPRIVATNIALLYWDSLPRAADIASVQAAMKDSPAARRTLLAKFLSDPRARRRFSAFAGKWLGYDALKSGKVLTEGTETLSAEVARAMADESDAFFMQEFLSPESSFERLFTSDTAFVSSLTARVYGVADPGPNAKSVALPERPSAGLLSQGAFLTSRSLVGIPPVLRGLAVREKVLCKTKPNVPPDIPREKERDASGKLLTTRERLDQHRNSPSCKACHSLFDGYGFGLENFDRLGRYRTTELGAPLTGVGEVGDFGGGTATFQGAAGLGRALAASHEARACFVETSFRMGFGRSPYTSDGAALDVIAKSFAAKPNMRELFVSLGAKVLGD